MTEAESSPSVPETVDASEEDLPSHRFYFRGEEDDDGDDNLGGVGGSSSINSSMSGYSQAWY